MNKTKKEPARIGRMLALVASATAATALIGACSTTPAEPPAWTTAATSAAVSKPASPGRADKLKCAGSHCSALPADPSGSTVVNRP